MDKLWITLLDCIAPRRYSAVSSHYFDRNVFKSTGLQLHRSEHSPSLIRHHWYVLEYTDSAVQRLFQRAKFEGEYEIMSEFIEDIATHIEVLEKTYGGYDLIIPVAPDQLRYNKKGYSFASITTRVLKNNPKINVLVRKKYSTLERNKQKKSERLNLNTKKYVVLTEKLKVIHRILLLDDIITTGSTLEEHAKVLKHVYPNCMIDTLCISGG